MKALVIVDLQNDFLPGGALGVREGDLIVPLVNQLMADYEVVVATMDWHPADHGSFAVNHEGREVYEEVLLGGLPQTLWPVHCVQWTGGAMLASGLESRRLARVFPKGEQRLVDSYSGFADNGGRGDTGLGGWLRERGVTEVDVCGLATEFCVKFTVLDALRLRFEVRLLAEACRGVELTAGDCERAIGEMAAAGAVIV